MPRTPPRRDDDVPPPAGPDCWIRYVTTDMPPTPAERRRRNRHAARMQKIAARYGVRDTEVARRRGLPPAGR